MSIAFMAGTDDIVRTTLPDKTVVEHYRLVDLPPEWAGYSLSNENGRALLGVLGLDDGDDQPHGTVSIYEARRAVWRARATWETRASRYTRATEVFERRSVETVDGLATIRRAQFTSFGLDLHGLSWRLETFEQFVEAAAAAGATRVMWG